MTKEEAHRTLTRLQGYLDEGSLATYRADVADLYEAVTGKQLRKCNCKDILEDALIEIYSRLKKTEQMANARLVKGVVLWHQGKPYTNANLTDKVAREFLAAFPVRKDWFAVLPPAEMEKTEKTETKKTTKKSKK